MQNLSEEVKLWMLLESICDYLYDQNDSTAQSLARELADHLDRDGGE